MSIVKQLESADDRFLTTRAFAAMCGPSIRDCFALGYRFDREVGFTAGDSESWLLRYEPAAGQPLGCRLSLVFGGVEPLTGLWRSPSGSVWVSSGDGAVIVLAGSSSPIRHPLASSIDGVHGIRDDLVFAWSFAEARLFRFDGAQWHELSSPGRILRMSGASEDALLAGGAGGVLAWWEGAAFRALSAPYPGTFAGVTVGDERAWACTHEGDLFEVSRDGLQRRSRFEAALLDVVEWQGRPLVAAGDSGVLEPGADTLELSPVGERFMAESFGRGASASVIVMADTGMVQTRDFVSYDVLPDFHFHEARDGNPPLW